MSTVSVPEFNILIMTVCDVYGRKIKGYNNLDYSGCNNDFYEALSGSTKSKMFFLNTDTSATVVTEDNITNPESVSIPLTLLYFNPFS